MFIVPVHPVVVDRSALKDCDNHKGETVENCEDNGAFEHVPDDRLGKDPEEEEKEGELQQRHLEEVEDLQNVQPTYKSRYFVEWNCPNISSQSIHQRATVNEDHTRHASQQC